MNQVIADCMVCPHCGSWPGLAIDETEGTDVCQDCGKRFHWRWERADGAYQCVTEDIENVRRVAS